VTVLDNGAILLHGKGSDGGHSAFKSKFQWIACVKFSFDTALRYGDCYADARY
jgi:hypothetical protein